MREAHHATQGAIEEEHPESTCKQAGGKLRESEDQWSSAFFGGGQCGIHKQKA